MPGKIMNSVIWAGLCSLLRVPVSLRFTAYACYTDLLEEAVVAVVGDEPGSNCVSAASLVDGGGGGGNGEVVDVSRKFPVDR